MFLYFTVILNVSDAHQGQDQKEGELKVCFFVTNTKCITHFPNAHQNVPSTTPPPQTALDQMYSSPYILLHSIHVCVLVNQNKNNMNVNNLIIFKGL